MCSSLFLLADLAIMLELRAKQDEEENQTKILLFFDHVPRKARSFRPNFENRKWGSSFRSILLLKNFKVMGMENPQENPNCSSRLLKKMEMKNPQNPNSPDSCLTENRGHKRPAVSHGGRNDGSKKAKIQSFPKSVRKTPSWLLHVIKDMNGENPIFIFEKQLTTTDVNPSQSRLLIPLNGLMRNDFLTPEELSIIQEDIKKDKKIGVRAKVVNSMSGKWNVTLKTWDMKKKSGNGSSNYALTSGWNQVVKANEFEEGENIGVWSFRSSGTLCFALIRLPRSGSCSSL